MRALGYLSGFRCCDGVLSYPPPRTSCPAENGVQDGTYLIDGTWRRASALHVAQQILNDRGPHQCNWQRTAG
jgi:hypothetical protein